VTLYSVNRKTLGVSIMSTATTTNLKLDAETKERVERLAAARQQSPDGIMQEAIVEYVTRAEKREQFRLDTVASWEHYRATGLHVTDEEFDEWVAKLEAVGDAPAPKCHV
jgi:predicted transcriptional regulator